MKEALVGYTGFVGSNINAKHEFNKLYNSKNIVSAFGTNPDLLVYAGISAEMFLANKFPDKDKAVILNAISNIEKINPSRLVLISTISVYDNTINVDENSDIDETNLTSYGFNRRYIEKWVIDNYDNYLIVRLPALYGKGIKKNFIYDMLHSIPSLLNENKYKELNHKDSIISESYELQENGFYKCIITDEEKSALLKEHLAKLGFNAMNFTDSRSQYQFYNLSYLWNNISSALSNNIKILNTATAPVSIAELTKYIYGVEFKNEVKDMYPKQDYHTVHNNVLGGENGYLFDKNFVLNDIKKLINTSKK